MSRELPNPPIKAQGPWILVLIEPQKDRTDSGIYLVRNGYDKWMDPGIGHVLSVADHYFDLPPEKKGVEKTPKPEDFTFKIMHDLKRGDRILFRRFLRTMKLAQPITKELEREISEQYPGHEICWLHVDDVIGELIEEQPSCPTTCPAPC